MKKMEKNISYGKRMIEIKVRFFTSQIASAKNKYLMKHCWDAGVVRIAPNHEHGIKAHQPIPFSSLPEILVKIEKLLKVNGIKLHHYISKGYYCCDVES